MALIFINKFGIKDLRKGTLFVVATPIGNMEDITFRAIRILKEVDFILCEDTRETSKLLKKYEIPSHLVSFNAATESKKLTYAIDEMLNGRNIALVSDAGTPTISDPGVRLVNLAHYNEIQVSAIPGANAAISALSICGLPTDSFVFEGFLPQKKGRQKKIKELVNEPRTIVLYESPFRIEKLLTELNEYMPKRTIAVAREITKIFEEVKRGIPSTLLQYFSSEKQKGEFVVIISPKDWF